MIGKGQVMLAIDIGTTHCKAALFTESGKLIHIAKIPTMSYKENGFDFYDPAQMWQNTVALIREVIAHSGGVAIAAIGITSMAETGLLVDRSSGEAKSPLLPWFSRCAEEQAQRIDAEGNALERFIATGLRSSFKYGLAKLLWLQDHEPDLLRGSLWLSAADFISYRLTGALATDYTLAARTFAFRIDRKSWDRDWIRQFGLNPSLFPDALPAGTPVGVVSTEATRALSLQASVPVIIAGHDHISAAFAVGAIRSDRILNSMGTAETLVGSLNERKLTERDFASGLAFGLHVAPDTLFWMGGLPSSGGSVEWLRSILGNETLSYDEVLTLLNQAAPGPTGIIYYPYLSGSGAPHPDGKARAAFIGIQAIDGKPEMLKAVLEGTAYEMESIRRAAEQLTLQKSIEMIAVGGGTNNKYWLQIKSDISGCKMVQFAQSEAALLGASMLAGIGAGVYSNPNEAFQAVAVDKEAEQFQPDTSIVQAYKRLYTQGYIPLQAPLRAYYNDSLTHRRK